MKKQNKQKPTLVGRFFHSYDNEQVLIWQGEILAEPTKGIFLVSLFDAIGALVGILMPTDQRLVKIEDMLAWKFYDSEDALVWAYEKYERRTSRQAKAAA